MTRSDPRQGSEEKGTRYERPVSRVDERTEDESGGTSTRVKAPS